MSGGGASLVSVDVTSGYAVKTCGSPEAKVLQLLIFNNISSRPPKIVVKLTDNKVAREK